MSLNAAVIVERIGNLIGDTTRLLSSGSDIEIVIKSILVAGVIATAMVVGVALLLSLTLNYGRARIERSLFINSQSRLKVAESSSFESLGPSRRKLSLKRRPPWREHKGSTKRKGKSHSGRRKVYLSRHGDLRVGHRSLLGRS